MSNSLRVSRVSFSKRKWATRGFVTSGHSAGTVYDPWVHAAHALLRAKSASRRSWLHHAAHSTYGRESAPERSDQRAFDGGDAHAHIARLAWWAKAADRARHKRPSWLLLVTGRGVPPFRVLPGSAGGSAAREPHAAGEPAHQERHRGRWASPLFAAANSFPSILSPEERYPVRLGRRRGAEWKGRVSGWLPGYRCNKGKGAYN
jgi:hypothetical protein